MGCRSFSSIGPVVYTATLSSCIIPRHLAATQCVGCRGRQRTSNINQSKDEGKQKCRKRVEQAWQSTRCCTGDDWLASGCTGDKQKKLNKLFSWRAIELGSILARFLTINVNVEMTIVEHNNNVRRIGKFEDFADHTWWWTFLATRWGGVLANGPFDLVWHLDEAWILALCFEQAATRLSQVSAMQSR